MLLSLTPTDRTRVDVVGSWDLSDVRIRVKLRMGWSEELADEAIREYRKFIALVALEPDKTYGMAEAVDEVWHQHLLHTRDYLAMCDAILGRVIHHEQQPLDAKPRQMAKLREQTLHDLCHKFVGPLSGLWSSDMQSVAKCCNGHIEHALQ